MCETWWVYIKEHIFYLEVPLYFPDCMVDDVITTMLAMAQVTCVLKINIPTWIGVVYRLLLSGIP